jgi:hypothetical protein
MVTVTDVDERREVPADPASMACCALEPDRAAPVILTERMFG